MDTEDVIVNHDGNRFLGTNKAGVGGVTAETRDFPSKIKQLIARETGDAQQLFFIFRAE